MAQRSNQVPHCVLETQQCAQQPLAGNACMGWGRFTLLRKSLYLISTCSFRQSDCCSRPLSTHRFALTKVILSIKEFRF